MGKKLLSRALDALRTPGARLVLLHTHKTATGNAFFILPRGGRISDETAQQLLERNDVQPYDPGLLPGHPQSWRLGAWRKRTSPR
jgi:hypothetical protein